MRRTVSVVIIVVQTLLPFALGYFLSLAANILPDSIGHSPFYIPVLGLLTVTSFLVITGQNIRQERAKQAREASSSPRDPQNRRGLLEFVLWMKIDSVLGKSLPGTFSLVLNLREQSEYVANPRKTRFQQPGPVGSLPSSSLPQVYQEAAGKLLILGEGGSGKTTLLLTLARERVEQALLEETLRMPAVFNLSSWAEKQQPLTEWLIEELQRSYQLDPLQSRLLVEQDQLALFLDGLDRVPPQSREACVQKINTYLDKHGLVPVVLCCRSPDYLSLNVRLRLVKAVVIEPLGAQEVDVYLAKQEEFAALGTSICNEPALKELLTTPLMLGIVPLAFQEESAKVLMGKTVALGGADQIFASFVQYMLKNPPEQTTQYPPEMAKRWLTWLAWQLHIRHKHEFFLELMQPDWLPPGSPLHAAYVARVRKAVGLLYVVFIMLFFGCYFGVLLSPGIGAYVALGTVPITLLASIPFLRNYQVDHIRPPQRVGWSWTKMRRGLFRWQALLIGLVMGLVYAVLFSLLFGPRFGLADSVTAALGTWLYVGIVGGLSHDPLDNRRLVIPNEGVWRAARDGIILGVVIGVMRVSIGVLAVLTILGPLGRKDVLVTGLALTLAGGLSYALYTGLDNGGLAYIQHFELRRYLRKGTYTPSGYARFLHYAAGCDLLTSVGNGYTFFQPSLQDFFAKQIHTYFPDLANVLPPDSTEPRTPGKQPGSPRKSHKRRRTQHRHR